MAKNVTKEISIRDQINLHGDLPIKKIVLGVIDKA